MSPLGSSAAVPQFVDRNDGRRHSADHSDAIAIASRSGATRTRMSPGAMSRQLAAISRAGRSNIKALPSGCLDLKALRDSRGDRERFAGPDRRRPPAIGCGRSRRCARQAHCVRSDFRPNARPREPGLACGPAGGVSPLIPVSPIHTSASADWKDRSGQDEQQLRAGREPREPVGQAHAGVQLSKAAVASSGSAQLADEIDEIVRDRFTKRVVVDRTKRTSEVAGALLASIFLRHVRFF